MSARARGNRKTSLMAALISALAAVLMVAVGPGFGRPNENASDKSAGATAEETVTAAPTPLATQQPHSEEGNDTASSIPDTHGHIGSGTGTSTGSQADPGHKEDTDGTDGVSNGPGTGDEAAEECLNEESSVNGDTDPGTGGANVSGPYDSTCDGRISQNGQGDDANGAGTPCAGCVGNADDKNPPGQVSEFEGRKPNDMGYECDGNQGVGAHYGNGNPAHTGDCGVATTTTTATPTTTPTPTPTETPTPEPTIAPDKAVRDITIGIDCFSITVTGTHDISNVKITFVDGELLEANVNATLYSATFTEQIVSATAKSGTLVESATAPVVCAESTVSETPTQTPTPEPTVASDKKVRDITIGIDCFSITVTGTHDISNAKITFVDGELLEVNVNATSYSATFTKQIVSATAKSGQLVESATAPVVCAAPTTTPTPEPTITQDDVCPEDSDRAGDEPPGGDMEKCDQGNPPTEPGPTPTDTPTPEPEPTIIGDNICPEDTDRAGDEPPGGDMEKCDIGNPPSEPEPTPEPEPTISGDATTAPPRCPDGSMPPGGDVNNCFNPPVCPSDSPMAGELIPGGDVSNCYTSTPPLCPSDSEMPGEPVPGNPADVTNCYSPPVCPDNSDMPGAPVPGNPPDVANCFLAEPLCPADSDKAGEPMPGGDILRCYNQTPPPTDICPAGTDLAGLPMPEGDISNCNDAVLGGVIEGPGDGTGGPGGPGDPGTQIEGSGTEAEGAGSEVLGTGASERTGTEGRILPFTGTSIMAYVLIALELMGAGLLMMRARRRRR
ncbi:MAG: hypothetical protein ACRDKT_02125 [Actinomycetota bacterium]